MFDLFKCFDMKLKGKLIIIGGAEAKEHLATSISESGPIGILARVLAESAKRLKSRIEVVTTASSIPEEVGKDYIKAFRKLKAINVGLLHIHDREESSDSKILKRLDGADVVLFTGGDQLRLTTILGGTPFYERLIQRLKDERNFMYVGTSAGAAVASESMISEGSSQDAILKGEVRTTTGFGFVENVVFDTHFITRGRIGRLFQIIATNPKILGVGLEEDSGLLIYNDKMEAIGPGMTILIDGREIRNNNLLEIRDGAPISIDNMKLHVMSRTDIYDLKERHLNITTPDDIRI